MKKYYVCMTDKFMSGWGPAENKINKYCIECDTLHDAETAKNNARLREEMKFVNINVRKPYYSKNKYLTSMVKFDDLGEIWKV